MNRIKRSILFWSTSPVFVIGWWIGLVIHRLHDGMIQARRSLDSLDDEVIERGCIGMLPVDDSRGLS